MHDSHRPRKRFGQNFLVDDNVITQIVDAIDPKPKENLVEIGAGLGAITDRVFERTSHLQVIEIDRDLSARLQQKYQGKDFVVHEADALKFDFSTLFTNSPSLRVFGNLPYNISTPLLFHLLEYSAGIKDMIFMLQKEVVTRMAASPCHHEYGRLSVMIQYACQVTRLFDISPQSFAPPPKVMSSMVILRPYHADRPHPLAKNYAHFANLVNVAFQHRRKTLKNALGKLFPHAVFEQAEVDPLQRPETVTVSQYIKLSNLSQEL